MTFTAGGHDEVAGGNRRRAIGMHDATMRTRPLGEDELKAPVTLRSRQQVSNGLVWHAAHGGNVLRRRLAQLRFQLSDDLQHRKAITVCLRQVCPRLRRTFQGSA